eukprot:Skav210079  [mRNA]  locus=scaffold916:13413:15732:+ [translate_table: standard]
MTSEVFFVDLAGRENERTTRVSGERLVELSFINRSLMWLSQCIYSLGMVGKRRSRIHSGLDRPRSESLQSEIVKRDRRVSSMDAPRFSTISEDSASDAAPQRRGSRGLSGDNSMASYTTLNFAASLKSVKVHAKAATRIDKDSLISGLQSELQELRQKLSSDNSLELSSQLEVANGMLEKYRASWQEKIEENQQLRHQTASALKRLGLARFRVAARSLPPASSPGEFGDTPWCPHLLSQSDPQRSSGAQIFFPLTEKGCQYSLGSSPECHCVLPRTYGVAPKCAFVWLEEYHGADRLFIRLAASSDGKVPRTEVNHQQLQVEEVKELFHGDVLVFGSSSCFSVNLSQFPVGRPRSKAPPWWALGPRERSKMISEIRGPEANPSDSSSSKTSSLQVALHYVSVLQGQNLDREGVRHLDQFLANAKRAAELVAEERGGTWWHGASRGVAM